MRPLAAYFRSLDPRLPRDVYVLEARRARQRVRERRRPAVPPHLPAQRARDPVRARGERRGGAIGGGARERLPRRDALRSARPEARSARLARRDDGRVRAHADDSVCVAGVRDLHPLGRRQRLVLAVAVGPPRGDDPGGAACARLRSAAALDERGRRARRRRGRADRLGRAPGLVHRPLRDRLRDVRRLHARARACSCARPARRSGSAAAGAPSCATVSSPSTHCSTPPS